MNYLTHDKLNAILTIKDIARILKVSEISIRRLLRKNEIPAHKVGGQWRFVYEEILEWLKEK